MRRRVSAVALAAGLVLCSCGGDGAPNPSAASRADGPGPPGDGARPPVILISIDTLRSDRLPVYGYEGVSTPALDRFAAEAVVFERAYSHYPLTLPSHVSMLSGRLPAAAGVRGNSRYRLGDEVSPYLPETLSAAGYATAGAVSTFVLRADTGISRGFDHYFDVPLPAAPLVPLGKADAEPAPTVLEEERAGGDTLAAALPWLSEHAGGPFFLFFHVYEPHLPHAPPEPFRARWGDTYEGEIAAADQVVGELLDELRRLGVYDEALIFVLSDHGEEFGEHGEEGHGLLLYRQSLQVPLLMKLPASLAEPAVAGRRHPHPVQMADILPTVLDVVGLESAGSALAGTSLRALLAGGAEPGGEDRPIFSETLYPRIHYGWHELTSLILGDLHLVAGLRAELFDLAADPDETRDVLADRRRDYRVLDGLRAGLATPFSLPTETEDEETKQRLASLGYLSSSAPVGEPTRDPRDVVPELAPRLKRADDALRELRHADAERLYQELLALDDRMPATWQGLGLARMGLDDHAGALEAFERTARLDPQPETLVLAARCLVRLDRLPEAEEHLRLALAAGQTDGRDLMVVVQAARGRLDEALRWAEQDGGPAALTPQTLLRLARSLAQAGRVAPAGKMLDVLTRLDPSTLAWNERARLAIESGDRQVAHQALERAMAIEPRNAGSLEWLGLLALQDGRLDEAASLLAESLDKDADRANAWNLLAVTRFQQRDAEAALTAWQQAVRLDPDHLDALYNLGLTAARVGRRDLALRTLRRYVEASGDAADAPERSAELAEVRTMIQQLEAG